MLEESRIVKAESEELQNFSVELLKEVQEITNLLIKTLKIFCIYPADNPIPKEFKNNLFKKLSVYLQENEELKFRVAQSQLLYKDKVVVKEEKKDEGISFAFYRDGIREIAFQKGMDQEELFAFLEIISRGLKSTLPEDDLVTLFWEKELAHIKFLVVDEFLSEELVDLPQPVGEKDLKKLYYSEVNLEGKTENLKELPHKIEVDRFLRDLDLVPEKELEELKTLLEKDESFEPLKESFAVLEEILFSEKEYHEFSETVKLFEKLLDSLIGQGDFYLASELLLLLKNLEKTEADTGQSNRTIRIKEAVDRAGDKERMRILTQILNQKISLDLFSVKKYLSLLSWNSIPDFVDMLGELENFASRKMVCSILENVGEKNINLLSKGIYDRRWYVVRNIVGIFGRISSPLALPYLKKTIAHEDIRVRKETLEALSHIEGKEGTSILLNVLADPDERLRLKAAKVLSQRLPTQEALDYVSALFLRKDFRDKNRVEKETLLETWAKIGKDEAIPLLKKLILKKVWFKREKQTETSSLALKSLASIGTPLSQESLKEFSLKSKKKIQKQAKALWEKVSTLEKT
ncbi:MAG TPA: HEAT repeat domain-containing protein [candidate division Zixibacteria bacterium]